LLVLRNEEKVGRWRQQKELFRANRQAKSAHAQGRLGSFGNTGATQ
jgi:hypothetical protein